MKPSDESNDPVTVTDTGMSTKFVLAINAFAVGVHPVITGVVGAVAGAADADGDGLVEVAAGGAAETGATYA